MNATITSRVLRVNGEIKDLQLKPYDAPKYVVSRNDDGTPVLTEDITQAMHFRYWVKEAANANLIGSCISDRGYYVVIQSTVENVSIEALESEWLGNVVKYLDEIEHNYKLDTDNLKVLLDDDLLNGLSQCDVYLISQHKHRLTQAVTEYTRSGVENMPAQVAELLENRYNAIFKAFLNEEKWARSGGSLMGQVVIEAHRKAKAALVADIAHFLSIWREIQQFRGVPFMQTMKNRGDNDKT